MLENRRCYARFKHCYVYNVLLEHDLLLIWLEIQRDRGALDVPCGVERASAVGPVRIVPRHVRAGHVELRRPQGGKRNTAKAH
jgi:hypothetical protein